MDDWIVPKFQVNDSLKKIIDNMPPGEKLTLGAFDIEKGSGPEANNIDLMICAPKDSSELTIKNDIKVTPGIYSAFIGLENFFGLARVDNVVKLQSEARFSDLGALASQTQVVDFQYQSAMCIKGDFPTTIRVRNLNVYFKGIDLLVCFDNTAAQNLRMLIFNCIHIMNIF